MKQYCFYQNYREVRLLVIHCSATRYDRDFPVEALRSAHKDRGFADIGYHYYITRDGELHRCRPGEPDRGTRLGLERSQSGYLLRGWIG